MKKKCKDCGICCLETDMLVSELDIELILNSNSLENLRKEDFSFKNKEGYIQLKNIKEHCYFLDIALKSCIIYENRPQGCRFYPLIYDREKKSCILDSDCPRRHLFYQNSQEFRDSCKKCCGFGNRRPNDRYDIR